MNFSLPWIFIFLCIDPTNNSDLPVGLTTATLSPPPDHTEDRETVPDGRVTILRGLRPVLPADLRCPGRLPPGELEAVALDTAPACGTLSWAGAGAENGEIQGVGLGHYQPQ